MDKMDIKKMEIIGWFEIPVRDMDRAIRFYEDVFAFKLERHVLEKLEMAWFGSKSGGGISGSLVSAPDHYVPSDNGVLIYLNAPSGDLENEISRVEKAGGEILRPKTLVSPEFGYVALILDSEGNRIAVRSPE